MISLRSLTDTILIASLTLAAATTVTALFRVPPPRWESAVRRANGGMGVVMTGQPGAAYRLQFSTDLTHWENGAIFNADASGRWVGELPPPLAGQPVGYYRAASLP